MVPRVGGYVGFPDFGQDLGRLCEDFCLTLGGDVSFVGEGRLQISEELEVVGDVFIVDFSGFLGCFPHF